MRHHAIIVRGWKRDLLDAAHTHALELFPPRQVTRLYSQTGVGLLSFRIGVHQTTQEDRESFMDWCDTQNETAGHNHIDYVLMTYPNGGRKAVFYTGASWELPARPPEGDAVNSQNRRWIK